ncbi:hypothetical protein [Stomatohabitans albus]|uniref:hypothetical protein n=1 Tax=Stomatohabitans albus TaxID=3110766 RepID=UPI00300D908E
MPAPSPPPFVGPAFPLPARLDRLAERWARLPWRMQALITVLVVCALILVHINRVSQARGEAKALHTAWVATETLAPGDLSEGKFVRVRVPEQALPALAVTEAPTEPPVLPIVAGTVATTAHFDGVDKAPNVPVAHRAVAITSSDADLYAPGAQVDLWELADEQPSILVEHLTVVSVKQNRVVVGVPDALAARTIRLQALGQLQLSLAGPETHSTPNPVAAAPEQMSEHPLAPPSPSGIPSDAAGSPSQDSSDRTHADLTSRSVSPPPNGVSGASPPPIPQNKSGEPP